MWVIVVPTAQWNKTLCVSGVLELSNYEINDQTRTQVNDDLKCVVMRFADMWELLWKIHR
jgi:hypothetical protein